MALIEKLTAIGDKLRQLLGTEEKFTLAQMPGKMEGIFDAGKQAQNQDFWDKVPMVTQKHMFAGPAWNVNTFFPTKNFYFSGILTDNMFSLHGMDDAAYDLAQRLEQCGVVFDFSQVTRANNMFYNCNFSRLPFINLSGCSKLSSTFSYSGKLHTIDGLQVSENTVFESAFFQCTGLANLAIGGIIGQNGFNVTDCPLTRESLLSILNALKDGVSGLTVTLGANNLAKLTDSEKAIATNKGWVLQ